MSSFTFTSNTPLTIREVQWWVQHQLCSRRVHIFCNHRLLCFHAFTCLTCHVTPCFQGILPSRTWQIICALWPCFKSELCQLLKQVCLLKVHVFTLTLSLLKLLKCIALVISQKQASMGLSVPSASLIQALALIGGATNAKLQNAGKATHTWHSCYTYARFNACTYICIRNVYICIYI